VAPGKVGKSGAYPSGTTPVEEQWRLQWQCLQSVAAGPIIHSGRRRVLRHETDERKVRRGFNLDRETGRVELTVRAVALRPNLTGSVELW
jgi:hypothetical protein